MSDGVCNDSLTNPGSNTVRILRLGCLEGPVGQLEEEEDDDEEEEEEEEEEERRM